MTGESQQLPEREDPAPPDIWVPASHIPHRRQLSTTTLLLAGFAAFISVLFLALAFILVLLFINSDLIAPGVSVMGINIGSMTRAEATAVLQDQWQHQQITLEHGDGAWSVPATELGMAIEAEATAEQAYASGRSMESLLELRQGGWHILPIWSFDAGLAANTLSTTAAQLSIAPTDAGISIDQGNVIETPAAEGRALDIEGTMANLAADPAAVLESGRLPLITKTIPPTITDASEAVAEARRLLSISVSLQAFDPVVDETFEWTISPDRWGEWLSLTADTGNNNEFHWYLDEPAAAAYLNTGLSGLAEDQYLDSASLIPDLMAAITSQQAAIKTRVYHYPRQHIVQSGETLASIGRTYGIPYPWIQQANPGSDLLQAGSTISIPSVDEMLPLPAIENKRIIVSISQQRAWVYEDHQLKWEWPVSTGIEDSPTAPGIFQIQNHEPNAYASNWDLWMPHFMGIYRPVPTSDFMNGFHGFPTRGGSNLLWTGDLGHPVTYGCILLSSDNAALLYDWATEGVVVEVQP